MRQTALGEGGLARLKDKINDPPAAKLIEAATNLDRASAQAKRPELGDDIGQQLSDCNPPLPCLLALFAEADPVAACFDEEPQGMMEVTPEPNLIIPLDAIHAEGAGDAFHVLGVACEILAAASKLIDLMPGNDRWAVGT
jgi:hypothetical protein